MPPLVVNFLDNDDEFLADKLSTPERYASALNLSIEEVTRRKEEHQRAMESLHQRLASDEIPGREKHILLCQHRLKHGRHPFVCDKCWSYLPICVCSVAGETKFPLPTNLSVVVWTHHREWGLTSNTGGLLGLMLDKCLIFMKGLPEHDEVMDELILDPETLVVILWPDQRTVDNNRHGKDEDNRYVSLESVTGRLSHHKVVLVAIDGTWGNARRMVARLPRDRILFTDLSVDALESVLGYTNQERTRPAGTGGHSQSLLASLRGRSLKSSDNLVCTAEAVTAALLQLGLPSDHGDRILHIAKQKVDLVCRYRAKVQP